MTRNASPLTVAERTPRQRPYVTRRARTDMPLVDRLMMHVRVVESGCWEFQLAPGKLGYGTITIDGTTRSAHRLSYTLHVGPIPAGLQLDHLCRSRICVNPAHLEPVTPKENIRRARAAA